MRAALRPKSCLGLDWRLVMGRSFPEARSELSTVAFFLNQSSADLGPLNRPSFVCPLIRERSPASCGFGGSNVEFDSLLLVDAKVLSPFYASRCPTLPQDQAATRSHPVGDGECHVDGAFSPSKPSSLLLSLRTSGLISLPLMLLHT